MSWTSLPGSRRRVNAWSSSSSSECSPLEVERSSYATFPSWTTATRRKTDRASWEGRLPIWTIAFLLVLASLILKSRHSTDNNISLQWQWDHNHYSVQTKERNLLMLQMAGAYGEVTSRPNRAYAKRWGWDFLLQGGSGSSCDAVRTMMRIMSQQERDAQKQDSSSNFPQPKRVPYDAILILPPDAIILDLDYNLLTLLPKDKLVAVAESKPDLFLWNVNHVHSLDVAQKWLDLSGDCDSRALVSAMESFDKSVDDVQPLPLSPDGMVEPRVIKFLIEQRSFAETMATLQTVADSVCYRYYPRCEVM